MSRFYLHLHGPGRFHEDDEGYEFADVKSARDEAIVYARDLMAENLRRGLALGLSRYFQIMNAAGEQVAHVSFADAVPPE